MAESAQNNGLEDDHSLSYHSVQQIHNAFEIFWNGFSASLQVSDKREYEPTATLNAAEYDITSELHIKYIMKYLSDIDYSSNEAATQKIRVQSPNALPALDSEAEDDLDIDAKITENLRGIKSLANITEQSSAAGEKNRPRKRRPPELIDSDRHHKTRPSKKQAPSASRSRPARPARPRSQKQPATSGVLSCAILVNRYDVPSTLRALAVARRKKQAVLKRKRRDASDLDVDALWAAHWRMKDASRKSMSGNNKLKQVHIARKPFLDRTLRRGRRCFDL
ncbi:uncharacterized protein V2V93DRAFT_367414 [Kockiozyma suomiensis]|uniref:uncharacterized protein n=1 Tax=Kockiozyma suomiensis TaxID=1337062 RepID=UPI003343E335